MARPRLTRIFATGALAATLIGGTATSSHAISLPVTSVQEIAGAAPTNQVRWWGGYGWRGYGWGWRRPYYGGGALAAGLIGGLALGTVAASAGSYYGYGYPAYYGGYGYSPSAYYAPAYYGYYPVPVRLLPAGLLPPGLLPAGVCAARLLPASLLPPGLLPARLLAVTWQGR